MSRPLTDRMAAALAAGRPLVLLAALDHPDGTIYLYSGVGSTTWNGHTFIGSGVLGSIAPVKHNSDLTIQELAFVLSGIDAQSITRLNDNVRNRSAQAWLGCLGDRGEIVDSPYQLIEAELDYQSFDVQADGTATLTITARSGFYTLERAIDEVWSSVNQKKAYPADTGMDQIAALVNKDILWAAS